MCGRFVDVLIFFLFFVCVFWLPQSVAMAHEGARSSKITYLGTKEKLVSVGFTKQSMRQFKVWDPRNMTKEIKKIDIDQAAGACYLLRLRLLGYLVVVVLGVLFSWTWLGLAWPDVWPLCFVLSPWRSAVLGVNSTQVYTPK